MDKQKSQLLEINNEIGDIQSEIKTKEKIFMISKNSVFKASLFYAIYIAEL